MFGSKSFGFSLTVLLLVLLAACGTPAAPTSAPPPATNPPPPPTTQPAAATTAPTAAVAPTAAPTSAPTTPPTAAPSGAANTLVWLNNIDDIVSFDPAEGYEFSDWAGIHSMYETLVKFDAPDLATVKPALATKWDIKDAGDHWEVTFTLRGDAKSSAGNTLTADDVVYSFQRGIKLNKPPAFLWTDIAGLKEDSIKAASPTSVVLSMPKTASPLEFLNVLTAPPMGIVDSKEVKTHETGGDFGNGWLRDHSAGSGPYMMDHWTKDVEFLLKPNPNATVKPVTPNILIKHVPEASNQQAILEKGDADIAQSLSPEQIKAEQGKAGIATSKAGNLIIFYMGMNVNMKPLDNNNVREAIRTAIDYDGIANDLLSGNVQRLNTVVPIGLFGANTDKIFQKDVAKAKKLLADGGVPNGFEIDMLALTGNQGLVNMGDLAAKIQADLAEIGVKVNVKQQAAAELLATYRAQKAPIVLLLWGPDFPDPDANGTPFADAPLGKRNNYDDPKAKDLAKKAQLETDPDKRKAAYKELTDYLAHNGPFAILFQPNQLFAYRSNVKNFVWSPAGFADLWTIGK
ncbi:MAG: ABC transporter substrate-binding protein [Chloroflexi bacterium]|nr:MAG: ABC transporter substrate-binding protein [Chloroflexota bacterium]